MWYAGMEGGHALADILFGDVNPSGKLPITFPKKLTDSPAHSSERTYPGWDDEDEGPQVVYGEDVLVGYRWFDTQDIEPLFPFGHGLSYTTFTYSNLGMNPQEITKDDTMLISIEVENAGERAGAEVVQCYIGKIESKIARPVKELVGFQKISLPPKISEKLEFVLSPSDFAYYDESSSAWKVEEGQYMVYVGSSSRDIRLQGEFEFSP
jgi:beta-glucosidase